MSTVPLGRSQHDIAGGGRSDASDGLVLAGLLFLFPLVMFPQYLVAQWTGAPLFFPEPELIHFYPRVALLAIVGAVAWRQLTLRGVLPKLLVLQVLTIGITIVVRPDPDGLWYTLFGSPRRFDGPVYVLLLTIVVIEVYGYVAGAPSRDALAARVKLLIRSLVSAATIQAVLIVLQRAGIDPVGWAVQGSAFGVADGTLGHPGFAAGFLMICLPLAFGYGLATVGLERGAWLSAAAAVAVGIGATGNRSSVLAILAVLVLFAVLRRSTALAGLLALTLGFAYLGAVWPPTRHAVNVATQAGEHYSNLRTVRTREQLWSLSATMLKDEPSAFLTGFGPSGFWLNLVTKLPASDADELRWLENGWAPATVVKTTYEQIGPKLRDVIARTVLLSPDGKTRVETYYPVFDRAHNAAIDRLIAYGLPNAMLWLVSIVGALVVLCWKRFRDDDGVERWLLVALTAYLVYSITWFTVVQTELMTMAVLALAWAIGAASQPTDSEAPSVVSGT